MEHLPNSNLGIPADIHIEIMYRIVEIMTTKLYFGIKKVYLETLIEKCKIRNESLKDEDIIAVAKTMFYGKIMENEKFIGVESCF